MNYEKAWKILKADIKGIENDFKNNDPELYATMNRPDDVEDVFNVIKSLLIFMDWIETNIK